MAVKLGSAKKNHAINIYMALVLERDENELHVKFMKRTSTGLYVWPVVEDQSWETVNTVVSAMHPPILNSRERLIFLQEDLDNIIKMHNTSRSTVTINFQ